MHRIAITAVAAIALSTAACGKKDDANDNVAADPGIVAGASNAATPATTPASAGQSFADAAAASDTFEIESSRLAASKAGAAKVKRFAEQMIKAHTDSTAKLKTAAAGFAGDYPGPALTAATGQLESCAKSGADFDQAYGAAQVDAHQTTLDALKAYSANGEVASLKAFATELVPIVTGHLNMAKGL